MNLENLLSTIGLSEEEVLTIKDPEKGKDFPLEEKFNQFLSYYKSSLTPELTKLKDEEANSIRSTTTIKTMKNIAKELGITSITMTDIEKMELPKFIEAVKLHIEAKSQHTPDDLKLSREKNDTLAKQIIDLQDAIESMKSTHTDELSKKEKESMEKVNKFFVEKYMSEQISGYGEKIIKGLSMPLLSSAFEKAISDNGIRLIWDEESKSAIPVDVNGNKGIKNPFSANGSYANDFGQLFTAYGNKEKIFAKNNNSTDDSQAPFDKNGNFNTAGISDNTRAMAQKMGIQVDG